MKTLVIGNEIVKTFGQGNERQTVLKGVSVKIENGEFIAVMGPSGSGKSTLLFALSGLESIDGGTVTFNGNNLAQLSEDELSKLRQSGMGFVFQQPTLLKNLDILDNILLPALRGNHKNVVTLTKKAEMLMQKMGIEELKGRSITEVSGGQLQRAGICRALLMTPEIIFCDEPTGALNSKSANETMKLFTQINAEGVALLIVTHDAKVAANAKRILFMRDGSIVDELRLSKTDVGIEENIRRIVQRMEYLGI
jgi:putative ABC transport system ATP-binding protein